MFSRLGELYLSDSLLGNQVAWRKSSIPTSPTRVNGGGTSGRRGIVGASCGIRTKRIGCHIQSPLSQSGWDMSGSASRRGEIFLHRGDLSQARIWYERAVGEARTSGSPLELIEALGNLGNVCAQLDMVGQAEACYREILEIQREGQGGNATGETLVNLGNLKADTGQPEMARAYYLEAIDYLKPLGKDRALGILYSNLALQELQLHRAESAVEFFQEALTYHRKVGNEDGLATTYGQLGKTFLHMRNFQRAEACLNNATEHFIKLGNAPGEAGALRLLANLYREKGEMTPALRCLERVIQIDQVFRLSQYEKDRQCLEDLGPV